ncbi:SBBP repeat-containing protein [Patescibacteria group bacterium]
MDRKKMMVNVAVVCALIVAGLGLYWSGSSDEEMSKGNVLGDSSNSSEIKIRERASFFIKNEGQIDDGNVRYYTSLHNGIGYVAENGIAYDFTLSSLGENDSEGVVRKFALKESFVNRDREVQSFNIEADANKKVNVNLSYFIGGSSVTVPAYSSVGLGELWDNIEVNLNVANGSVEKVFTVNPGGDVSDIVLSISGADNISVDNETGELELKTALDGELGFSKPFAYQEVDGKRVAVYADYNIQGSFDGDFLYGFNIGDYDKSLPLVIDPLLASTYMGGVNSTEDTRSSGDHIIDSSGNIIVVGSSMHNGGYPTSDGSYSETWNGNTDIVISKFNSDLTELISSTYFGGSGNETGSGIALDSSGNIFIFGGTTSVDLFSAIGGYDETHNGGSDIFVAKFSSDLKNLYAATYLGGSNHEVMEYQGKILVDAEDNIIVSGTTHSENFPVENGYDISYNGEYDIVLGKFNNDLSVLMGSTFVGGLRTEVVNDMAFNPSGDLTILGVSRSGDFPVSATAHKKSNSGSFDYVIFNVGGDLMSLGASTFLGGSEADGNLTNLGYQDGGIAVSDSGEVFVVGSTSSSNFETTEGAFDENGQSSINHYDGFVSKFDAGLENLLASTFLGGSANYEGFTGVVINQDGNPVVVGVTTSADYPTKVNAYSENLNGGWDIVLTELNSSLSDLKGSTYFGGTSNDFLTKSIKLDSLGNPVVFATTASLDFPTTSNAYSNSKIGIKNNFGIFKIGSDLRFVENNIPSDVLLSSSVVLESQSVGTTIGALSAVDADISDAHVYSMGCATAGVDDSYFGIIDNSLVSGYEFDYENPSDYNADNFYEICVRADDGNGGLYDKNLIITILNLNEAPTDILLHGDFINENELLGTVIGYFATVDEDLSDTHVYSMGCATAGVDDPYFGIIGNSLVSSYEFDYENPSDYNADNFYEICVRTDDGNGESYDKDFPVMVNNSAADGSGSTEESTDGNGSGDSDSEGSTDGSYPDSDGN